MAVELDPNSTQVLVATIAASGLVLAGLVQRGDRRSADRMERLADFVVKLDDKVDALDDKVGQLAEAHETTRSEVETIRRHQLLDVLAGRDKRSWRQLLLGRNEG